MTKRELFMKFIFSILQVNFMKKTKNNPLAYTLSQADEQEKYDHLNFISDFMMW